MEEAAAGETELEGEEMEGEEMKEEEMEGELEGELEGEMEGEELEGEMEEESPRSWLTRIATCGVFSPVDGVALFGNCYCCECLS